MGRVLATKGLNCCRHFTDSKTTLKEEEEEEEEEEERGIHEGNKRILLRTTQSRRDTRCILANIYIYQLSRNHKIYIKRRNKKRKRKKSGRGYTITCIWGMGPRR